MKDLELIKRSYFDIKVENGELKAVEGIKMKEQFVELLVYSTWKPSIQYGVDIRKFKGMKGLEMLKAVILDRIAKSIAFINYFYPEKAKLPDLKGARITLLSSGKLAIRVIFEGLELNLNEI